MRVADERRFYRLGRFGFFQQRFQFARRAGKGKRFDTARHQTVR
jgi:hypothetical protein